MSHFLRLYFQEVVEMRLKVKHSAPLPGLSNEVSHLFKSRKCGAVYYGMLSISQKHSIKKGQTPFSKS